MILGYLTEIVFCIPAGKNYFVCSSWNILVSECCPGNNATDCDFQAGQSVACQSQVS